MSRPQLEISPYPVGPVPNFLPPGASPPPPPPPLGPLAQLAADLEALHRRALAASRDDRMHPLGVRDDRRFRELLATLRGFAAASRRGDLPELIDPPIGRALALDDLLPYLAPARRVAAILQPRG